MRPGQPRLGAQLWLEQDADPERVDFLVGQAAAAGLDLLRVFLMWPWMEPSPGEWVYDPFDAAFEAATRHGVGIKATLTANSGPWHIGTPSVLHSTTLTLDSTQRPAMRRYVEHCVRRYCESPALRQWVIWNEPLNNVAPPRTGMAHRTGEHRRAWHLLLQERYGDIGQLNRRWRTGYRDFSAVDFPEDLPHPAHRGSVWESYAPWLDDWRLRVRCLHEELGWVAAAVSGIDPRTPLCVNPPDTLANHCSVGYDLPDLATVTDVLGASFHAPWQLTFAPREAHLPLVVAGISLLASASDGRSVELTEFQTGNTYYAGRVPLGMRQSDVCSFFLAPLLAGAASATGWSLNTRQQDFEAGDWGLLDDVDQLGYRSEGVRRVRAALELLDEHLGSWQPAEPQAVVLTSEISQAVQLVTAFPMPAIPGRQPNDAIHGSALLTAELLRLGIPAAMAPAATLGARRGRKPDLLVVSHMTVWDTPFVDELERRVRAGAVLLLDGTSGHKTPDAALHRPWPGGLPDRLGLRATGLFTDPGGFPVTSYGAPVGRFPLVICQYEFSDRAWSPVEHLRLPGHEHAPCVWTRTLGQGRVVLAAGPLGPAVLHDRDSQALARQLLSESLRTHPPTRPLSPLTMVLPVHGDRSDAAGVFAPPATERGGQALRLALPPGSYLDIWSGAEVTVGSAGEVALDAADGIAVLVGRDLAPARAGRSERPL